MYNRIVDHSAGFYLQAVSESSAVAQPVPADGLSPPLAPLISLIVS
jgi:hypothetical protein